MARPPSPAVAARNHEIYSLWQRGKTLVEIAKQFEITPQRAGQIVAAFHPEEEEEGVDRSLYRGYLWRLFEEIRELYRSPGYKISPNGRPAEDPDGNPAEDTNVKLQAGELELKILESLRKLDARDKPAQQNVRHSHEFYNQQAAEDIARRRAQMELTSAERAELEALRRQQAPVVPGEVVRELPPAST